MGTGPLLLIRVGGGWQKYKFSPPSLAKPQWLGIFSRMPGILQSQLEFIYHTPVPGDWKKLMACQGWDKKLTQLRRCQRYGKHGFMGKWWPWISWGECSFLVYPGSQPVHDGDLGSIVIDQQRALVGFIHRYWINLPASFEVGSVTPISAMGGVGFLSVDNCMSWEAPYRNIIHYRLNYWK